MRRILVSVCLLLAIALPCQAQGDKTKPNTLTPKEIADGWILLFDGETTFGWNVEGKVTVADGALLMTGDTATPHVAAYHATDWRRSYELRFEYRLENPKEKFGAMVTVAGVGPYGLVLQTAESKWHQTRVTCFFNAETGLFQNQYRIESPGSLNLPGGYAQAKLGAGAAPPAVRPGFVVVPGSKLQVRNIKLKPLAKVLYDVSDPNNKIETVALKPLFNGKDLTGWKEFPGKKSKFTVTDGAITVTNGPGDLQTTGKYQDFVLQLECKSNGKHLNSGIFFRCKDNEYQNGYEAQIFNKFTPEATQDYTIEEYDPKTNKLLAKNKIKATAVDFGTGAIYRRVPARKEMSKDGEWFGMTIVAYRNHLATWVNGVQVVDWHDNRPKSDNARTGCKLEAGHFSIQGHDPTTDLSFRNLRIAELVVEK